MCYPYRRLASRAVDLLLTATIFPPIVESGITYYLSLVQVELIYTKSLSQLLPKKYHKIFLPQNCLHLTCEKTLALLMWQKSVSHTDFRGFGWEYVLLELHITRGIQDVHLTKRGPLVWATMTRSPSSQWLKTLSLSREELGWHINSGRIKRN